MSDPPPAYSYRPPGTEEPLPSAEAGGTRASLISAEETRLAAVADDFADRTAAAQTALGQD